MAKTKSRNGEVDWYSEQVILKLDDVTRRGLEAVAARIDALTKLNIVANDQVDTGFMVNSVYFATAEESSYLEVETGTFIDKNGRFVERELAPEADLPGDYEALVCVGANYAIYQEMAQAFLYPALVQAAAEAGGIIEKVAKE
jgi:hypothetical protein